jgi:regulator of replication initiation timing
MDIEYMKESIAVLYEANEKLRTENEALKSKLESIRGPVDSEELAAVFYGDESMTPMEFANLVHKAILKRIEEK